MKEVFEFNYESRRDKNIKEITSIDELATILVKCQIVDDRTKEFNIMGFDFEELLYNEKMNLKNCFCAGLLLLIEYSLYFEQKKPNPQMCKSIYEAMKFAINIINDTKEKRRNCRYNKIIEIIKSYEEDFYGNSLKNMTEEEKNKYIKEEVINHSGELLYFIEYYRLTHNAEDKKIDDFWEILLKLVKTIDKIGKQKEIKFDRDIDSRILSKRLQYLDKKKQNINS